MGIPTSEVGYTSAMPRREDHEVHKKRLPSQLCMKVTSYVLIRNQKHFKFFQNMFAHNSEYKHLLNKGAHLFAPVGE